MDQNDTRTDSDQEITISATFIRETEQAWCLDCEGDEVWFPKSQVRFRSKDEEVVVPKWLYRDKFPNEPI